MKASNDKCWAKQDGAEHEGRAKKVTPSMAARKAKKRDAERKARKKSTLSKRRNRKNK